MVEIEVTPLVRLPRENRDFTNRRHVLLHFFLEDRTPPPPLPTDLMKMPGVRDSKKTLVNSVRIYFFEVHFVQS